ncbi:MAG: hypothetical protein DRQ55_02635 [Planctomycetota bacterium]|nr:MAG: hypothetical protein DRQ55_02635 [Planctomycetota bacterium]
MARKTLCSLLLVTLGLTLVTACASPFSGHGADVRAAMNKKIERAHRRFDRHFYGLDWDDPTHEWHDESYARGPMIR